MPTDSEQPVGGLHHVIQRLVQRVGGTALGKERPEQGTGDRCGVFGRRCAEQGSQVILNVLGDVGEAQRAVGQALDVADLVGQLLLQARERRRGEVVPDVGGVGLGGLQDVVPAGRQLHRMGVQGRLGGQGRDGRRGGHRTGSEERDACGDPRGGGTVLHWSPSYVGVTTATGTKGYLKVG
ncbi:hypothetical protein C5U48_20305 [Mycolicibacter virginiensis]|uniref:Uncharacterized protein n=1 Tax=Mycolicibacter virginiensis TaxID=1795032 RepID=A0A9X7NX14_9MYCO|nr:hypothetical protein C5U48_20305 [Mycolicibacter virginiensis]